MNLYRFLNRILRNEDDSIGGDLGGGGSGGGGASGTEKETSIEKKPEEVIQDLKNTLEAALKESARLKAHNERILDDTKDAREKARLAALESKKIEDQKAREEGNFKQLLETREEEKRVLSEELTITKRKWATEKEFAQARSIASELIDPTQPQNAELLAKLIKHRISYELESEKFKVVDEKGEETLMTLADFKKEVDNNPMYASLLKSSQRSGGGAKGAGGGASRKNTMSEAEYKQKSTAEQKKFIKSGGTVE